MRSDITLDAKARRLLADLADRYETESFLEGDPSCFMHRVSGDANREATGFVAASLSFGARSQFLPRVQWIIDRAGGDVDGWIRAGRFERDVPPDAARPFYRFFTYATMNSFFRAYRRLMEEFGTLGAFVAGEAHGDAVQAVAAICRAFRERGDEGVVPKDAHSACKRVCMFLRWMVRTDSPVDIGLWADAIDRRTLVVPMDTHVVQEARRLGLLKSATASMASARRLTAALAEAFPDDPCRGDFALFGLGVMGGRPAAALRTEK